MEKKKCSIKKHSEVEAIIYCQDCHKYFCKKCHNCHSELFEDHHLFNIDKNIEDIFTGFCEEQEHNNYKLEIFCKTHNKLCCLACIYNLDDIKGYGKHKKCDICNIDNIIEEKKDNLKNNIKTLENLSNGLENSIKEIKPLFEKINKKKDELKVKIQTIFTKIRSSLNKREDELLLEVDDKFNKQYISEEFIKNSEKFQNKIKISLEKGKLLDNNWDNNNLNSLINECLNIENNIKDINAIKENIKKFRENNNIIIDFKPDIEEINSFLETIEKYGDIYKKIELKSNIFKSMNDIDFILTHLKNEDNPNNKQISLNLLFQATKDGQNSLNFHQKCKGFTPQLIFIKTKKDVIFGGFTEEGFQGRECYVIDNKAFIFSFSKKKIYKVKAGKYAISDYTNNGPCFYGSSYYNINVPNKMMNNYSNTCPLSDSYYEGITKDYELNNGEFKFEVQEIEVYQILYN